MEMERNSLGKHLSNRLWKWKEVVWINALGSFSKLPNTICNHFRQPFMEMEKDCVGTAYGNGKELFGQAPKQTLIEMKGDCLAIAYGNSVLHFRQQCLTL